MAAPGGVLVMLADAGALGPHVPHISHCDGTIGMVAGLVGTAGLASAFRHVASGSNWAGDPGS